MGILVLGFFFKIWKKKNYFVAIKNFNWTIHLVFFSSYCELVLLLWSVLAAPGLKVALPSGRFEHLAGLSSWIRVHAIADTPRPWEEGIKAAFQVLGSDWDPEPRRMSRDHLTPAVKAQSSRPRWTPSLVAELPGPSAASVTPTQAAIAVIRSSRRCH